MLQAGVERQRMQIVVAVLLLLIFAGETLAQDPVGPGILALRDMLKDKNPQIRVKAAEGLGRVGGPESVATLRGSLSDKEISVRISAVEALGFIGGRQAMGVLLEALKDSRTEVRLRAVEALKDAGTINSIPLLAQVFTDKDESVRLHAALMLRKIGHRNGVPVLGRVALNDKSPAVRAAAAQYLGKVGVKDQRAVGLLSQVAQDKEPAVRLRAVESLGFLQLATALTVIERSLKDPDLGVRIRATAVLGHALAKEHA